MVVVLLLFYYNHKTNLQLLSVVKVTALKEQIHEFYRQIINTEATVYLSHLHQ